MTVERIPPQAARRQLAELQRRRFALRTAAGAMEFDAATLAAPGNRYARACALAVLNEDRLALTSSAEGIRLMDSLEACAGELDEAEKRELRLLLREGAMQRAVNQEEYCAFRKLAGDTAPAWERAKALNDFSYVEEPLGRLVFAAKRIARQTAPDMPEYDFWLDRHEEGLTAARCEEIFGALRGPLMGLIARFSGLEAPEPGWLHARVPIAAQHRLAHRCMAALGVDADRCRLAVSDRAFTSAFSKYDVRVAACYAPDSFADGLYGVMHECGHALYELGIGSALQFTSLGEGASTGVHECQALFFENQVGRSLAWTRRIWDALTAAVPELLESSPEEFYRAVNALRRTTLRVESDEAAYCLHIMLRFETERALFSGELSARDAPAFWDELSAKYFGLRPKSLAGGILQDSHWTSGEFGYFPAYALGAAGAAQLMEKLGGRSALDCGVGPVCAWLEEHIWRFGAMYPPNALMRRALGGPLDVRYYINYLSDKLSEVYGVDKHA